MTEVSYDFYFFFEIDFCFGKSGLLYRSIDFIPFLIRLEDLNVDRG